MKLTKKVKLAIGSVSLVPLVIGVMIGVATPAIAPTKAQALQAHIKWQTSVFAKYENADSLSNTQLVELLSAVGFTGQSLKEAWAIAKKETNGRPLAHNGNRKTGDNSYGLFQVNMLGSMGADRRAKFGLDTNADLLNPVVNAQVAYHMSKGGKDWSAWKGTHNSIVKAWIAKFPDKAKAIAKAKAQAKAQAKAKALAKAKAKAKATKTK